MAPRPGPPPAGGCQRPTVVIQHTRVRTPVPGVRQAPPYAESVGSGTALVLRDGKAWTTHWSRPNAERWHHLHHRDPAERMTFTLGQVWVVLAYR